MGGEVYGGGLGACFGHTTLEMHLRYPAQILSQQLDTQVWISGAASGRQRIHLGVVSLRPGEITRKWM